MIKLRFKSRSRRVVRDSSFAAEKSEHCIGGNGIDVDEDGGRCCWERLPSELLREVLVRVEESESTWPWRKHVVACAGVCRRWRNMVKEMVEAPEVSGKITFPISVKQPGPRESLIRCFIQRDCAAQTYYLYVSSGEAVIDDGKFILAARKCRRTTCTEYVISLRAVDKSTYIGKLRGNLLGRKFTVYDALPLHCEAKMSRRRSASMVGSKEVSPTAPVVNYPVAHISYDLNVFRARRPRRMSCILDAIPASTVKPGGVAPTQAHVPITSVDSYLSIPFFHSKSNCLNKSSSRPLSCQGDGPLVLQNKYPRWHEELQCWCLNFHGRVGVASVKNFQMVAAPENGLGRAEHDRVILQFGKVSEDLFIMDYGYPLSAFQAFAICLSSFDKNLACNEKFLQIAKNVAVKTGLRVSV